MLVRFNKESKIPEHMLSKGYVFELGSKVLPVYISDIIPEARRVIQKYVKNPTTVSYSIGNGGWESNGLGLYYYYDGSGTELKLFSSAEKRNEALKIAKELENTLDHIETGVLSLQFVR